MHPDSLNHSNSESLDSHDLCKLRTLAASLVCAPLCGFHSHIVNYTYPLGRLVICHSRIIYHGKSGVTIYLYFYIYGFSKRWVLSYQTGLARKRHTDYTRSQEIKQVSVSAFMNVNHTYNSIVCVVSAQFNTARSVQDPLVLVNLKKLLAFGVSPFALTYLRDIGL